MDALECFIKSGYVNDLYEVDVNRNNFYLGNLLYIEYEKIVEYDIGRLFSELDFNVVLKMVKKSNDILLLDWLLRCADDSMKKYTLVKKYPHFKTSISVNSYDKHIIMKYLLRYPSENLRVQNYYAKIDIFVKIVILISKFRCKWGSLK